MLTVSCYNGKSKLIKKRSYYSNRISDWKQKVYYIIMRSNLSQQSMALLLGAISSYEKCIRTECLLIRGEYIFIVKT